MVMLHTCKVEGCEKQEEGRTVCRMHYERYRRNGKYERLTYEEKMVRHRSGNQIDYEFPKAKECTQCHVLKTIDNFFVRKTKNGDRPYSHCKECHKRITAENDKRARARKRAAKPAPQNGGICIVNGCDREQKVISQGLCSVHYYRVRAGSPMEAPIKEFKASAIEGTDEIRRCTICDGVQESSQFYKRPDGSFLSQCKGCHVSLSKVRQSIKCHTSVSLM